MATLTVHIIPVDDERPHDETEWCWCGPSVERLPDRTIVVHNSADMREEFERMTGDGLPSKGWQCIEDGEPN